MTVCKIFTATMVAVSAGIFVALTSPAVQAGPNCDVLKAEYTSSVRPRFLRIVKRNQDVAAYFRNELRRSQAGHTPLRPEIRKAYSRTRGVCRNAACKSGIEAVYAATLQLYTFNRRWKNAGCPGYLSN